MRPLVILSLSLCSLLVASQDIGFSHTYVRYLSGHDLFRIWKQKFPHAAIKDENCTVLTNSNRDVAGTLSPATGEAMFKSPSPNFVKWYSKCLSVYIASECEEREKQGIVWDPLVPKNSKASAWDQIESPTRLQILQNLTEQMVGRAVVTDSEGFSKSIDNIVLLKGKISTFDALKKALFVIGTSNQFLTY